MPKFYTPAQVLAFKDAMKARGYTRIPQYRELIDGKMQALLSLKSVMAPDYQKTFAPYQPSLPAKVLFRLTNIMASNESEIRFKARSTDPAQIAAVQRHEHGHEALDPLLFPTPVRRRMYSFLGDSYTIVALDVTPKPGALADYANRQELESYAESTTEIDESDDSPKARYARAYQKTTGKTQAERHEAAYDSVTSEALVADGAGVRVRIVDPLTFKGFQTDEEPCMFAEGMEFGRKQLNPLLRALEGYGVREEDGVLYIDDGGKRVHTMSYKALGVGMIAESQSAPLNTASDQYVEYTQIRTCEETVILIENPGGKQDQQKQPGILIKVPNLFGGQSTGYYLIEGDAKLRSGDLEERYDPPLRHLMNEAQHYSITRTGWEAMALAEMTRPPYQFAENPQSAAMEPPDTTRETKSAQTEDGQTIPMASGKVLRVEGFGQRIEQLLTHVREAMKDAEPTDIWGGTGSSSETGIAIARRETALLTELTPYQANVATVCKLVHLDVDRYVAATGETIKIAYLPPEAPNDAKPEIREITPESAKLPMDMDYIIGSDTPESKYAAEQMSERRWLSGLIGKLDHMEAIGIKDPGVTEQRQIEDLIMTGVAKLVADTATSAIGEYAKAAVERELGPLPQPAPQIVGPNGQPISSATMPDNMAHPGNVQPLNPVQTNPTPQNGAAPVVAGGPPGVA